MKIRRKNFLQLPIGPSGEENLTIILRVPELNNGQRTIQNILCIELCRVHAMMQQSFELL